MSKYTKPGRHGMQKDTERTRAGHVGGRAHVQKDADRVVADEVLEEMGPEAPLPMRSRGRTGGSHREGRVEVRDGLMSELRGGATDLFNELDRQAPRRRAEGDAERELTSDDDARAEAADAEHEHAERDLEEADHEVVRQE